MKATATATAVRTSNETSRILVDEKRQILLVRRAFLYNLYENNGKFPFATLFEGRKHRDKFNFFPESLFILFIYLLQFNGSK